MGTAAQKISDLEKAMMELVYQSRVTEIKIQQLTEGLKDFKDEMRIFKDEMGAFKDEMKVFKDEMIEFKDEMKAFKDEMIEFKDEMKAFKDEMGAFKDEMKVFKDEMIEFKDEMKAFKDEMIEFKDEVRGYIKKMDKRWGDLARKMGTLVEDIFVPSFDLAIEKYFGIFIKDVMPRRKIRKKDDTLELDILAYADEKAFIVEVKASPNRQEHIRDFLDKLKILPDYLPEIKNYRIIPIYAALDMEKGTINLLTKNNIYAMIFRGDILEIVNFGDVQIV